MHLRFVSHYILLLLLVAFCVSPPIGGQVKSPGTTPEDRVLSLQNARDAALQNGDPARVYDATRVYLSELLLGLARLQTLQQNDVDAGRCYTEALQLQDFPTLRMEYGSFLLRSGKPLEAVRQFKVLTSGEMAHDSTAWTAQGIAYRDAGDNAQAEVSFEHALQLKQDLNLAYALASVLLADHHSEKANVLFEQILQVSKNAPYWHVAAGDAYRRARDYAKAIKEFRLALAADPKVAHAEFFLGLTFLEMNAWGPNAEAAEHLRMAVALSPREYLSNFYLGALESTQGVDLASSDKHLQAAAAAAPTKPEVWIYLGLNANREHRENAAENDFRKAIELTGKNESLNDYQVRRAYFSLGRLLITSGKKEQGDALLERYRTLQKASIAASSSAIADTMETPKGLAPSTLSMPAVIEGPVLPGTITSMPELSGTRLEELVRETTVLKKLVSEAYNDLGTAQARQQLYADALVSFQKGEQWQRSNAQIIRNLGTAAFRVGDFAEARRALSLYIEEAAGASSAPVQRARLMLGFSDFNLGKFDEAAKQFGEAQQETMADSRAAYSWAFSLARVGKAQEANGIADQLMQRSLPPEQLGLVCHLYVDNENYEGSLACYRKALAADPALQLAHYEAGQALVHLDRPGEAVAELEQEEKVSPGNANVQSALAYALLQASRKEEAQALLVRVTTEHPDQADAQYQLGKLLLEQGKVADAVAHLEASERANALPDYVHYQLGVAYKKAGRQADAERELKQYREIKDKKREASTAALPQAH